MTVTFTLNEDEADDLLSLMQGNSEYEDLYTNLSYQIRDQS